MAEAQPRPAAGSLPVSIVDVRLRIMEMVMQNLSHDQSMRAKDVVEACRELEEYLRSPLPVPTATPHPKA